MKRQVNGGLVRLNYLYMLTLSIVNLANRRGDRPAQKPDEE